MPRLTLMEEVLLLGLKDKAVCQQPSIPISTFMRYVSERHFLASPAAPS